MTDLRIRVKWKAKIGATIQEGIETEASWFLFDQAGGVYASGPFTPPAPCEDDYIELIPLIKIKDQYMSVGDIESMINEIETLTEFKFPSASKEIGKEK